MLFCVPQHHWWLVGQTTLLWAGPRLMNLVLFNKLTHWLKKEDSHLWTFFAQKNLACGTPFPWKNHKKLFVCGSSYLWSSAGFWPKPLKRSASIDIIRDVVARGAWRGWGAEDKQGDTGEVRNNTCMERYSTKRNVDAEICRAVDYHDQLLK
jgi:hypothetical protein